MAEQQIDRLTQTAQMIHYFSLELTQPPPECGGQDSSFKFDVPATEAANGAGDTFRVCGIKVMKKHAMIPVTRGTSSAFFFRSFILLIMFTFRRPWRER